jgi:hypothetical protein
MGSEILRGVYTERSECAQHDRAVTPTDGRIILVICIIAPWRGDEAIAPSSSPAVSSRIESQRVTHLRANVQPEPRQNVTPHGDAASSEILLCVASCRDHPAEGGWPHRRLSTPLHDGPTG